MTIAGLILALAVGEIGVRAVGYGPSYYYPRFLYVEDEALGYRLRPGFIGRQSTGEFDVELRISGLGLRGQEPYDAQRAATRILGLGDSFTFGTGVAAADTYLAVLERSLRAEGSEVAVINAGVPGYGTRQELTYFRRQAAELRPDIVLLGFVGFNDPHDNVTPVSEVRDGFLVARGREDGHTGQLYQVKAFLRNHAYLYSLVVNRLKESVAARGVVAALGLGGDVFPVEVQFYRQPAPPAIREAWEVTFGLLDELCAEPRALGARLIVLLIPSRTQAHPEWWRRVLDQYDLMEAADRLLPFRMVTAHLETRGIAYLDLLEDFTRAAASGQKLYFDLDSHWNREGHRVAAAAIHRYLRSHDLIPPG